jgi:hypothetical protein
MEMCRGCCGCAACVLGICRGGDAIIGDFERLRDASRERLLERPRTRADMAAKKFCSVGELPRDVGDVGEKGGDIWPDDCEVCEPIVLVRMGGIALKLD